MSTSQASRTLRSLEELADALSPADANRRRPTQEVPVSTSNDRGASNMPQQPANPPNQMSSGTRIQSSPRPSQAQSGQSQQPGTSQANVIPDGLVLIGPTVEFDVTDMSPRERMELLERMARAGMNTLTSVTRLRLSPGATFTPRVYRNPRNPTLRVPLPMRPSVFQSVSAEIAMLRSSLPPSVLASVDPTPSGASSENGSSGASSSSGQLISKWTYGQIDPLLHRLAYLYPTSRTRSETSPQMDFESTNRSMYTPSFVVKLMTSPGHESLLSHSSQFWFNTLPSIRDPPIRGPFLTFSRPANTAGQEDDPLWDPLRRNAGNEQGQLLKSAFRRKADDRPRPTIHLICKNMSRFKKPYQILISQNPGEPTASSSRAGGSTSSPSASSMRVGPGTSRLATASNQASGSSGEGSTTSTSPSMPSGQGSSRLAMASNRASGPSGEGSTTASSVSSNLTRGNVPNTGSTPERGTQRGSGHGVTGRNVPTGSGTNQQPRDHPRTMAAQSTSSEPAQQRAPTKAASKPASNPVDEEPPSPCSALANLMDEIEHCVITAPSNAPDQSAGPLSGSESQTKKTTDKLVSSQSESHDMTRDQQPGPSGSVQPRSQPENAPSQTTAGELHSPRSESSNMARVQQPGPSASNQQSKNAPSQTTGDKSCSPHSVSHEMARVQQPGPSAGVQPMSRTENAPNQTTGDKPRSSHSEIRNVAQVQQPGPSASVQLRAQAENAPNQTTDDRLRSSESAAGVQQPGPSAGVQPRTQSKKAPNQTTGYELCPYHSESCNMARAQEAGPSASVQLRVQPENVPNQTTGADSEVAASQPEREPSRGSSGNDSSQPVTTTNESSRSSPQVTASNTARAPQSEPTLTAQPNAQATSRGTRRTSRPTAVCSTPAHLVDQVEHCEFHCAHYAALKNRRSGLTNGQGNHGGDPPTRRATNGFASPSQASSPNVNGSSSTHRRAQTAMASSQVNGRSAPPNVVHEPGRRAVAAPKSTGEGSSQQPSSSGSKNSDESQSSRSNMAGPSPTVQPSAQAASGPELVSVPVTDGPPFSSTPEDLISEIEACMAAASTAVQLPALDLSDSESQIRIATGESTHETGHNMPPEAQVGVPPMAQPAQVSVPTTREESNRGIAPVSNDGGASLLPSGQAADDPNLALVVVKQEAAEEEKMETEAFADEAGPSAEANLRENPQQGDSAQPGPSGTIVPSTSKRKSPSGNDDTGNAKRRRAEGASADATDHSSGSIGRLLQYVRCPECDSVVKYKRLRILSAAEKRAHFAALMEEDIENPSLLP